MHTMLDEINETVDLIRHHYKDPRLDALKQSFKRNISRDISPSEQSRALKEYTLFAADFYERFCRRMRLMMLHAPEFDLISFMGP